MKTTTRTPSRTPARNIPLELAQIQSERGSALTRAEFKALGYSDDHLSEANIAAAAGIFQRLETRAAA